MNNAAMIFVSTALLIPLAALSVAGDAACAKVPTMSWADACLKSSKTPALYNLCGETLQYAPDSAKVTVYAVAAATAASTSFATTTAEAESQMINGARPGDEMGALQRCASESAKARVLMQAVISDMSGCEFKSTLQEYIDAAAAVESCAEELYMFHNSAVGALNAANRDITTVARALDALAISGR